MKTLQAVCDGVCEFLDGRVIGTVSKSHTSFQSTIEIQPNPEKIVAIEFTYGEDQVEIYDMLVGDGDVINLFLADPTFLEQMEQVLRRFGIKFRIP